MDWYPLYNSLRIAAISTVAVFFLGDERPEERTACFIPRRRKIGSAFAVLLCANTPRLQSNAEDGAQSLFQIFICSECP